MTRVTIASDYAVLETPSVDFYYVYEVTDGDSEVWYFQAKFKSPNRPKRTVIYSCHHLGLQKRFDVVDGLLQGIGRLINDGHLIESDLYAIQKTSDVQ